MSISRKGTASIRRWRSERSRKADSLTSIRFRVSRSAGRYGLSHVRLSPDDAPAAELETVDIDVNLDTAGESIVATAFSIDYDQTCLAFDDTDANGDHVPYALAFHLPVGW